MVKESEGMKESRNEDKELLQKEQIGRGIGGGRGWCKRDGEQSYYENSISLIHYDSASKREKL